jgi:hypothetical protein
MEQRKIADTLDLMKDEFERIQRAPGVSAEVIQLCNRAVADIEQHVPIIKQRDEALKKVRELSRDKDALVEACKLAYRKHHMDDDSIGWRELSTILHDALCNAIGVGEYGRFVDSIFAARHDD